MTPKTPAEIGGMGHSVKRKEDPRFIRGKGTYVDDIVLPDMLYLDIVRSPYAHAQIKGIDTSRALAIPGVVAVITGKDLAQYNLHWMPTLMSDTQMVLPVEKVMYQAQEVAAVLATERYIAADGADAVEIDYDPLPVVVDPKKALLADAPVLRTDKPDKKDNHIWHWEWGDRTATEKAFQEAEVTVKEDIYIPRIHVSSIETCGCIAHFDKVKGKLTVWMTTQAPHAIRTVFALVAGHVGLAEHKIRIISPDIGGGFGGKVPVYPGYVIAVAASVLTGKPVKWIEDRMENLQADSFARDYHITAELAAQRDGTLTALRIKTLADHGYTDAAANPSKFPAGLFHICTGSYDFKAAHVEVDGVYTNKPPGGIAYRCSFRVTEAVHTVERMVDIMAHELQMDPAELRQKNFIAPERFPYTSALGWEYDSGNHGGALDLAMQKIGYAELRREQAEKRQRGELMGIGISSFTEIVGAGPSKHFDILGLKMFDSCEIRIHPTGKAIARFGTKSQGQGHETTYAQILAEELGLSSDDISVEEGDTDTAPYGNHPPGMEAGLEAVDYYDPPNLTFPFGSYICVVDIDKGTGQVKIRRFVAVDDCGTIINPMIVEGQIHGGLTMGLAPALYEQITYDENGNILGGSFIDYLLPTAVETPKWETDKTCTPSPHHPLGAKGVGESATVGAPAAIANAVVDALWHLGVRHVDIPITPAKVWKLLRESGVTD